jgi:hypothetical protein
MLGRMLPENKPPLKQLTFSPVQYTVRPLNKAEFSRACMFTAHSPDEASQ